MAVLYEIAGWADILLWIVFAVQVAYLLFFAWKGGMLRPWSAVRRPVRSKRRFAVFFPACKEDRVIVETVESFLRQDYPADSYEVVVISDRMQDRTNERLSGLPVTLLRVDFENSSKARALTFAVDKLDRKRYDVAVVMDADNTVQPDFLRRLNETFETGTRAVQAHRQAKNRNTPTAVLDAVSEEINNAVFRAGHIRSGLSSALIGSGMAFDYGWFRDNIRKTCTAGEDKELEALLLKLGIYIHYLPDVPVYDEKTQRGEAFGNQRRRWLAAQFGALAKGLRDLPGAIAGGNFDYADKLFQWMLLPRAVLIAGILFFGVLFTAADPVWGVKWGILLWLLGLAVAMAIPDSHADRQLSGALRKVPGLAAGMVLNLFRLRGVNKRFIHTEHGDESVVN